MAMRETPTPGDAVIAYDLPLTADGDRTFSVNLGGRTYAFRSYLVPSSPPLWHLDVYDSNFNPLALGRRLVTGSVDMLQGYASALLDPIAAVVYTVDGMADPLESLGASLRVMWFPDKAEDPLQNGEPMDFLMENFKITQEEV